MNRMLAIYRSSKEPDEKLKEMCFLLRCIATNYGNFYWEKEVLKFYYYDKESVHIEKLMNQSSSGIIYVKERNNAYSDRIVDALEKEYVDKKIIQSSLYKINLLPFDLKQIFIFRFIFDYSVEKIKEYLCLSNKRYYQMIKTAKNQMIEHWGFDLKEE